MRELKSWMWADALAMLERAEQMQRQFFEIGSAPRSAIANWQPPVDMLASDDTLLLIVALPGVVAEDIQIALVGNSIQISGERSLPMLASQTRLLRFEIPHGVFERRIALPEGSFRLVSQQVHEGCLYLNFQRLG